MLLRAVGSHDVSVTPQEPAIYAAAWGYRGRLLVAARNGSASRRQVTVRVAREALAGCGARLAEGAHGWVMNRGALPARPTPAARLDDRGWTLRVVLEPGEAVLWGSWGWE